MGLEGAYRRQRYYQRRTACCVWRFGGERFFYRASSPEGGYQGPVTQGQRCRRGTEAEPDLRHNGVQGRASGDAAVTGRFVWPRRRVQRRLLSLT